MWLIVGLGLKPITPSGIGGDRLDSTYLKGLFWVAFGPFQCMAVYYHFLKQKYKEMMRFCAHNSNREEIPGAEFQLLVLLGKCQENAAPCLEIAAVLEGPSQRGLWLGS